MTLDPKHAWQSSVELAGPLPLEQVRAGADKFYRRIRRRNLIEYIACAIVVLSFGRYVFTLPHILQKVGSAMVVLAAIYTPWQLHRRASAVPPEKAGELPLYTFARTQLVRQRDALRSIFWWYILPFIPGLILVLIGNALDPALVAKSPPIWARWLLLGFMVAVFVGVWWLNQWTARRLQRRIDEIDALVGGEA